VPEEVKAKIMSNVTRAALLVEAEGKPGDVAAFFDEVLASIARHFPGALVQVGEVPAEGEPRPAASTEYATSSGSKASRTA